jgi:hypothetical protein
MQCKTPVVMWLIVMSGFYFLGILRHILVLLTMRTRFFAKNRNSIEALYLCIVFLPQVGWLIYGNTFHYSTDGIACKNMFYETNQLWILMMVLIAFGYIIFVLVCCGCCCVLPFLCCIAVRANN